MTIFTWIVVGLIVGWLANTIAHNTYVPGGILADLIIGLVGAFVGGWLFHAFGYALAAGNGVNVYSVLMATSGAIAFLCIWRGLGTERTN